MPYAKSPIDSNRQKPANIFYVWYSELCRRLNSTPAPVVKPAKTKCQTVLDFVADRLKVEEWHPVIAALRHDTSLHVIAIKSRIGNCQFLHEVDTEEKVRTMKRRYGTLWTAFILTSLLKSLSTTIRNTQVLTCLEFDGLPMFAQYLEPLLKALQKNKTLKSLSLSRCRISDSGCQMVCAYVRFTPNIEVLNLSGCGLTSQSGEHLAKLIKYQQINRYCESWHNSLRYSDPNVHVMRGLKRITLNINPGIGDQGLDHILAELDDDLWIKALDMQRCGITENMAPRIIDVISYSQSLEIADFRLNDEISIATLDRVLATLKEKKKEPEFQWCNTTFTLTCGSTILDSVSNFPASVHKTKSAPLNAICSKMSLANAIRRTKTSDNVSCNNKVEEAKVTRLNNQLQEEIAKRRQTERANEDLKRQLEEVSNKNHRHHSNKQVTIQDHKQDQVQTMITVFERQQPVTISRDAEENRQLINKMTCKNGVKNGVSSKSAPVKSVMKNGLKNGFHNGDGDVNNACTIFERLLGAERPDDSSEDDEETFLNYLGDKATSMSDNTNAQMSNTYDMSDSQISLIKFMENLKHNQSNLPVKVTHRPKTTASKYYINNKVAKK